MQSTLDMLLATGPMGLIEVIMLVMAAYCIVERLFAYDRASIQLKSFADPFAKHILQARAASDANDSKMAEKHYQEARELCEDKDGKPDLNGERPAKGCIADVFRRAIDHRARGAATLRTMLNNHIDLAIMPRLKHNLRPLSAIGKAGPMVGLLGTVWGMMGAFGVIAAKNAGVDQTELAENIGMALGTTVLGLLIALPVIGFSAYFRARVEQFEIDLDRYSEYCLDLLYSNQPPTIMDETLELYATNDRGKASAAR